MGDKAVDYHHGDMDIEEQVSTFHGFIGAAKWGSLVQAVVLVFLILLFCAHASFFQALGAAVVVAVLGTLALRKKKSGGH
jgi:hypothetical protein